MRNKIAQARYERKETRDAYLFLLPLLALVIVFVLFPVLATSLNSLFRDVTYLARKFVGLSNYASLAADFDFQRAARFTCLFTAAAVFFEAVLGLVFALLLNESFRGRGLLRTVVLIPWAIPTIVSAKIWKLIFDYTYGVLNFIVLALGLSSEKINWLGSSISAFWSLVAAEVWKTTPFMVLILLAGLQAIPREVYQQAQIDGARMGRRLWRITLPLVWPVLTIALIFRTIDSLRIFDLVYVLTGGGPGGSTKTLSMLGFEYYSNDSFGRGSAVSVITFLLVFAVTIAYIKLGRFERSLKK
ncbi:MAG: ABC transporter permease subunit [Chitinivibrionales bacterium]|nr:ABC transporter permease subunit [Chitinivibrionales bacterium]MBD3397440.1 ABC transporter permease subunit [Chitinivibrionales bacterium]